ncbi:MAG TPA: fibronectin type III domain-containing protein [Candidatus Lokiarchaeia archaeon]|nr:fibronectin type III domain-containing protein [Candidatus Lokiarchaeia archaeon]
MRKDIRYSTYLVFILFIGLLQSHIARDTLDKPQAIASTHPVPAASSSIWFDTGDSNSINTEGVVPGGIPFQWTFCAAEPTDGIICEAMDSANYINFTSQQKYESTSLSSGNHYQDSGTFTIPYSAQWYIVFTLPSSAPSNTTIIYYASITNIGAWPPFQVQTLTADASSGRIALSWTAPSNNGGSPITAYNVYRSTSSGQETKLSFVTGTSYSDDSVSNDTNYYYKVTANNSIGESWFSTEVSGIIKSPTSNSNNPSNPPATILEWLLPVVIAVVVGLVMMGIYLRFRKSKKRWTATD